MNIKNKLLGQYKEMKVKEQTKLREILQQMALLGLERHGFFEKAAFYGGTALRILFDLNRFSEDLDFTLLQPDSQFDFKPYLEGMVKELASFGFETEVSVKDKNIETNVVSAFLKANTWKAYLAIGEEKKTHRDEKVRIKIEVDTDPPLQFRVENRVVLNPVSFNVLTLHLSDLFAGKLHAVLYRAWKGRIKGRDWFDLIWYLQKEVPLSISHLETRMKQADHLKRNETLDRNRVLEMLQTRIREVDWKSAKADVEAFIADPEQIKIWSPEYFLGAIGHLKVE